MAKSMYDINMDFSKANTQAAQLEAIAKDLTTLANSSLEECMTGVKTNWTGSNAGSYVKKGEKLQENIKQSAKNLNTIAGTIRQIAKKTYEAEKAAYELAQQRMYGKQ